MVEKNSVFQHPEKDRKSLRDGKKLSSVCMLSLKDLPIQIESVQFLKTFHIMYEKNTISKLFEEMKQLIYPNVSIAK